MATLLQHAVKEYIQHTALPQYFPETFHHIVFLEVTRNLK